MDLAVVLTHLRPGARWSLHGDEYSGLIWRDDEQSQPTQDECVAAWPEVLASLQSQAESVETARQSALAKLTALGLTEAEALALVGGV